MQKYHFTLTGETPLLMHSDDVEQADRLIAWRKDPANANLSKPGDDRTPPWTWQTYVYTDDSHVVMPCDNLMVSLRQAGAQFKIKGNKTYKSVTQTGMMIDQLGMPVLVNGKPITKADVQAIDGAFSEHVEMAQSLGFSLFVKRAKVGQSKHIRVRPRFDQWSVEGDLTVLVEELQGTILRQIFENAGFYVGLGDWRPSSPKSPGPFGKFSVKLEKTK